MLVWYFHQYYGDNRILEEHYDGMKRLVDHFTSKANGYILSEGHFGDHMLPGDVDVPGSEQYMSEETPTSLVWTAFYYRGAFVVSKAAELLGRTNDAEQYRLLAEDIKNAFNSEWLDRNNGEYGDNRAQTANLLPLVTGIVPEDLKGDVLNTIVTSILDQYEGHHHTGTTGTLSMIEGLTKFGKGDVMYELVTQTNYPGWGYMVEQGATTIWENWGLGVDEESMIMWCMIDQFFYNDLAGIKGPEYMGPGYMTPGFKKSIIRPYIPEDLTYAKASMKTMYGTIVSDWKKEANGVFTFNVTIPANTTADIHVPKINYNTTDWAIQEKQGLCWLNGAWVSNTPGITMGLEEDEYIVFQVGSGEYRFQAGPEALLPVVPPEQRKSRIK
jgi:alpha-L-rhamnosidase